MALGTNGSGLPKAATLEQAGAVSTSSGPIPLKQNLSTTGPVVVKFTQDDPVYREAVLAGAHRITESMRQGLRDRGGFTGDTWEINIMGSVAEAAAALALGQEFHAGVNTFEAPDIGGDVQVRWTKYSNGHLKVKQDDADKERFVLVTGSNPHELSVVGWIWGHEAKQQPWFHDMGKSGRELCYWVPQSALHSPKEFKR